MLPGVGSFTALRTFRILRPLRSVKKVKGIKILVKSLFKSIPLLSNVILFLLFLFFVFSVVGTSLFKGLTYARCRETTEPEGNWLAAPGSTNL
jgi:hypothetical protein